MTQFCLSIAADDLVVDAERQPFLNLLFCSKILDGRDEHGWVKDGNDLFIGKAGTVSGNWQLTMVGISSL